MQHVNDDMDELFRRAGENYPLDTTGADWDKIAKALSTSFIEEPKSQNDNKKLLWLLLLLPLGLICTHYFSGNTGKDAIENNTIKNEKPITASSESATVNAAQNKKTTTGIISKEDDADKNKLTGHQFYQQKTFFNQDERSGTASLLTSSATKQKNQQENIVFTTTGAKGKKLSSSENASLAVENEMFHSLSYEQINFESKIYPSFFSSVQSAQHQNIASSEEKKNIQTNYHRNKKFYIGIVGGVDATSVKFQKVENASYDYGVLLGYLLSNKFSIETGLLSDKKFYFSKGDYFKTNKIYLPPNSKITTVDGNCSMWEVPVKLLYNFKDNGRRHWFAAAGISSYFMKKENYDYVYYYPQTGQSYNWYKSYSNASHHVFSVTEFSAGYVHKLGKFTDIRIEPYFKLPLKGVGVGSLPLQSAGVHIVITRKVF